MKEKKRIVPILPAGLTENSPTFEDESIIETIYIENQRVDGADFHHLFFKESYFKRLQISSGFLKQFECINVIFENCDFSNTEWIGAGFHQVEFRQCKLTGTNFAESYLKDCLFTDCMLDYASFAASTMKVVHFAASSLRQSDFSEIDWQYLRLTDCTLTQSQWFHTLLKNLDLSKNQFDTIATSPESIHGVIVNAEQALILAETLGIIVK
ncbi:pentapeptide repeat-containing protein [Enterococcus sp. BWT-B8]|uniref:pentapeptide repeat-containing protein n=1 Tax=Enterococcus sp. BWT-B8 TaxID=2885157 RepID=UPI001E2D6956|nr:pentapeptide repeat-containing protein [Enterococcus sp. BWT-B8]MCB5952053.1 pentapeptide repeat-containing protein [Enterococcus sp. BWT-B8]